MNTLDNIDKEEEEEDIDKIVFIFMDSYYDFKVILIENDFMRMMLFHQHHECFRII